MLDSADVSYEEAIAACVSGPAPRTITDLHARVSDMFHCMVGPPRAYIEIPVAVPGYTTSYVRGVYHVFKYAARGRREDFESHLCGRLWAHLVEAHKELTRRMGNVDKFLLFWRAVPRIEEYEGVYSPAGRDANGSETPEVSGPVVAARMRLWVPGLWAGEHQHPYPMEPEYVS